MDLDQEGLQSALVNLTIRVIDHRVLPPAAEAVYLSDANKPMVAPLGTRSILSAIHTVAGRRPHRNYPCQVMNRNSSNVVGMMILFLVHT